MMIKIFKDFIKKNIKVELFPLYRVADPEPDLSPLGSGYFYRSGSVITVQVGSESGFIIITMNQAC